MSGPSRENEGKPNIPGEGIAPDSATVREADPADATISEAGVRDGGTAPQLSPGDQVDHFTIRRLIGEGGMGRVYLARDTRLGRKVALKVLSPAIFGTATALEDFLREARITARFSHPNIVGIYAVGEHQGGPYIALEYLAGQTLTERIAEGAVGPREAARVGIAVARALEEAHAQGVLHRDLKPSNILIPRDGRLRVVDFGLARATRGSPAAAVSGEGDVERDLGDSWEGSPYYMSPEQWVGAADTPATDIWSLGLILHELATGRHPLHDRTMNELVAQMLAPDPVQLPLIAEPEVPAALCAVIQRSLDKEPEGRPSASEVAQALEAVARGRRGGWDPAKQSPYRGLLPFGEQHADLFFGREAEVDAFVERLRDEPTIAVVGPSGAGKSSFVRGGVIPRLRDQGAWEVLSVRPGSEPFLELARALAGDGSSRAGQGARDLEAAADLAARLRESPARLSLELAAIHEQRGCHVLLVLDQAEELFTQVEDPATRRRFLDAVLAAADEPAEPVRAVITIRDDFLFRLVEGTGAAAAGTDSVMILRTPDEQMLEAVLARPLEVAGYRFEDPGMLDEMVASVRGEVACLPLLEFAARMLWERRDTEQRLIRRAVFKEIGGVAGALANHADSVLDGLSLEGQAQARLLLTRLVTPAGTRRTLGRERVLEGLPGEAGEVLDRLIQARLLTVRKTTGDTAAKGAGPALELVHESLVATWRRLARWLEEGREDLLFLDEVGQAAELWQKRGHLREELWQGEALHEALRMLGRCRGQAPELVVRFLETARQRQARRQRRRRLLTAAVMAALVVVALVLAYQARVADRQRAVAQSRRAEALREGARAALSQGNMLEARSKLRVALEGEDAPAARALWWRLRDEPLAWNKDLGAFVYGITFLPGGKRLAVANRDGSVYLLDVQTRAVRVLRGHDDQVFGVASSRTGKFLASSSWNGKVLLWDMAAPRISKTILGHKSGVLGVDFSPDTEFLALSSRKGPVQIHAVSSGVEVRRVPGDPIRSRGVRYSPDGDSLLTWGISGTLQLWAADSGRKVRTLKGHKGMVVMASYSPDGRRIASGGKDGTVRLWDMATGKELSRIDHPGRSFVYSVSYSPDGELLATTGDDKVVRIWRVATGKEVQAFSGHTAAVYALAFSLDGELLASGGSDGTVKLWRVGAVRRERVAVGHTAAVAGVRFSPDGEDLISVSSDQTVRRWEVKSGRQPQVMTGHTDGIYGISVSPDGRLIASGGKDRLVRLWDLASGRELLQLRGHTDAALGVAFSPDGQTLASGSSDGTLRLWDVKTGRQLRVLKGHGDGILGVRYSPDGSLVATAGGEGRVGLWDVADGAAAPRWLVGHKGAVVELAFSPDGKLLASGGYDGMLRLWDPVAGARANEFGPVGGRIYAVAFRPGHGQVAAACSDGVARVYNLKDGALALELRGHTEEVNHLYYSPDGALLATAGDDTTVRVWDAGTGRPYWRAPVLLEGKKGGGPALLTHQGWLTLGEGNGRAMAQIPTGAGAVDSRVRWAARGAGGRLCVLGHDGTVELWGQGVERPLVKRRVPGARLISPLGKGCAVAGDGGARGGTLWVVAEKGRQDPLPVKGLVTALGGGGDELLAATARELVILDADARIKARREVDRGVTALSRVAPGRDGGAMLALGYGNGNLELVPDQPGPAARGPDYSFEGVPSSAVRAMAAGPMRTLVVGFANGFVGIWNQDDGKRMENARLHGPVSRLLLQGRRLYAVSDLGQHLVWDLSLFFGKRCEVVREVWKQVPVSWSSGRPVSKAPPTAHPCTDP